MEEIFRPKKSERYVAGIAMLFFVGMAVLFASLMLSERSIIGALFYGGFWGAWAGFCFSELLAALRESLCVSDEEIRRQGVFKSQTIRFAEIVDAKWRLPGKVILHSSMQKVTIRFDRYSSEDRYRLARWIHSVLPGSTQEGWELYCHKMVIPYELRSEERPLQEGEYIHKRSDYNRIFIPTIVLTVLLGVGFAWALQNYKWLCMPVPFLALWGVARQSIPAKGCVVRPGYKDKKMQRDMFVLIGAAIGGFFMFRPIVNALPWTELWASLLTLIWYAVFIYRMFCSGQRRQAWELQIAKCEVEEWERKQAEGSARYCKEI